MGASASRPDPSHRSLNCRVPTLVEFVNDTGLVVQTVRGGGRGRGGSAPLHRCPPSRAQDPRAHPPQLVDTRPVSHLPQVWLNYQGGERVYFALAPGARVRQPTFTTHPWRFQATDEPGTLCVVADQAIFYPPPRAQPDAAPPQAHIVLASSLPWSPRTHAAFPDAFRLEAATLLCCHHRLQHTAYSSGAAARGTAAAGLSAVQQQQQQQQVCGLQGWLACLPHLSSGGRSRPGTPCSPSAVGCAAQAAGPTKSLGDLPQVLQGVEEEHAWAGMSNVTLNCCPFTQSAHHLQP